MRIRTAIAVAALLPASLAFAVGGEDATPAEATTCRSDDSRTVTIEAEDGTTSTAPVEYCVAELFAQCENAADKDAAGKLILPTDGVQLTPDAPTASFTEGAGCGTVDEPVFSFGSMTKSQYQFYADGFAEAGNVDSLTFEAHFLGPNAGYAGEDLHLDVRILVDSVSLFGTEVTPDATGENPTTTARDARIVVTPTVSDSGASVGVEFTVTGIAELFDVIEPTEQQFRNVQIAFGVPHTGQCGTLPTNDTPRCVPSGFTGWVMGATEVPSGVTFNPAEPAAVTVPVVLDAEDA